MVSLVALLATLLGVAVVGGSIWFADKLRRDGNQFVVEVTSHLRRFATLTGLRLEELDAYQHPIGGEYQTMPRVAGTYRGYHVAVQLSPGGSDDPPETRIRVVFPSAIRVPAVKALERGRPPAWFGPPAREALVQLAPSGGKPLVRDLELSGRDLSCRLPRLAYESNELQRLIDAMVALADAIRSHAGLAM